MYSYSLKTSIHVLLESSTVSSKQKQNVQNACLSDRTEEGSASFHNILRWHLQEERILKRAYYFKCPYQMQSYSRILWKRIVQYSDKIPIKNSATHFFIDDETFPSFSCDVWSLHSLWWAIIRFFYDEVNDEYVYLKDKKRTGALCTYKKEIIFLKNSFQGIWNLSPIQARSFFIQRKLFSSKTVWYLHTDMSQISNKNSVLSKNFSNKWYVKTVKLEIPLYKITKYSLSTLRQDEELYWINVMIRTSKTQITLFMVWISSRQQSHGD